MNQSLRTISAAGLGLAVLIGLYLTSLESYLLFHTLVEMFSIVVACGIFIIGWNSKGHIKNNYLVFLAIAYLFIAFLDLLHTMSYKGMGIITSYDYYANQLWIATRYLESLSLFAAFLFLKEDRRFNPYLVFAGYAVVTVMIIGAIFWWRVFPVCFVEGEGLTPFKKNSEYVISAILLLTIWQLHRLRDRFDPTIHRWLVWSLVCTIIAELAFTFYVSNYGFSNLVGHYFKVFSFYLIYKALVVTGITNPHAVLFRALRDSESKFRILVESSTDFIWETDHKGVYTYASPRVADLLGYEAEEMVGRSMADFMAPEEGAGARELFDLGDGMCPCKVEAESTFLHRDGHPVVLERNGTAVVDENGVVTGFRGVDRDISERKDAEAMKDDIYQIMQHDLKTPLNGIINIPRLIAMDSNLTEDQRHLLVVAEQNGLRMLRLVNNSLNMFKIEQGAFTCIPEKVDVLEVVREVLREVKGTAQALGVTPVVTVKGGTADDSAVGSHGDSAEGPFWISAEPDILFSVLANFITNALEASPRGETVAIILAHGARPVVAIVNRGVVPEDMRQHFFQKFKTRGKRKGTGLGTYSAKLMADAMEFELRLIVSDEENTTTIEMTCPAAD